KSAEAKPDPRASRHYEPVREIERPVKSTLQNVVIQQERRDDQSGGEIRRAGEAQRHGCPQSLPFIARLRTVNNAISTAKTGYQRSASPWLTAKGIKPN